MFLLLFLPETGIETAPVGPWSGWKCHSVCARNAGGNCKLSGRDDFILDNRRDCYLLVSPVAFLPDLSCFLFLPVILR
jgi:hypothetical protein